MIDDEAIRLAGGNFALREEIKQLEMVCAQQDAVIKAGDKHLDEVVAVLRASPDAKAALIHNQLTESCRALMRLISATKADGRPVFELKHDDIEHEIARAVAEHMNHIYAMVAPEDAGVDPIRVFRRTVH